MPLYAVWCPEELGEAPEDGRSFEADGPEEAAALWAEWQDRYSAEYWIVSNGDLVPVLVLEDGTSDPVKVLVRGESSPTYYGHLQKAD